MSRYVHVAAPALTSLDQVAEGLAAMELTVERSHRRVMLEGSLECAGEPVDLRLAAGTAGSVEDFGFVRTETGIRFVCGEVDRDLLMDTLLGPLRQWVTENQVRQAADAAGLHVEEATDLEGRRRLVLQRR